MRWCPVQTLLVLSSLSSNAGARRGGRSGSSGGGDSDDGSPADEGSPDSGNGDSGSGLPDKRAPCGWWARQETFGIPGLYYNGNMTIRHHITHNTAWDDEDLQISDLYGCDNDDRASKTYTYPALLLIAPTGNESDTNPMHWVLRGFEPLDQRSAAPELDLWQRWVYIRSSDFVLTNYTPAWDSPFRPFRTYKYEDMDATQLDETTRVYWRTNVSSEADGTFSAHAEYTEMPPRINPDDYIGPRWSPGQSTSQYVTLSDVCHYKQKLIDESLSLRDTQNHERSLTGSPKSRADTRIWYASPRTLWLSRGATAELSGIGHDSMTIKINNTLKETPVWKGKREQGCSSNSNDPFELSEFHLSQSEDHKGPVPRPWNITVSVSISFEGSLVQENSTSISGLSNGKLQFAETYQITPTSEEEDDKSQSVALQASHLMWVASCVVASVFVVNSL